MHNIECHSEISKGTVTTVIFDACRANTNREPREVAGFRVTFNQLANGEHEAVMRDTEGTVVGLAHVDKFDC